MAKGYSNRETNSPQGDQKVKQGLIDPQDGNMRQQRENSPQGNQKTKG